MRAVFLICSIMLCQTIFKVYGVEESIITAGYETKVSLFVLALFVMDAIEVFK